MWEWAWESACPKEWGCRKKAQDLAQPYKINESPNGFENKDIASLKLKFYNCEKRIGWFDSGVEKLATQNVASQGPVHDCINYFLLIEYGCRSSVVQHSLLRREVCGSIHGRVALIFCLHDKCLFTVLLRLCNNMYLKTLRFISSNMSISPEVAPSPKVSPRLGRTWAGRSNGAVLSARVGLTTRLLQTRKKDRHT